jgi:hypothetical protein
VELLQYLAPGDGRPYPPDEHSNDLVHWQTIFSGIGVKQIAAEARIKRIPFISPGAVELPGREAGYAKTLLVRDPDGHAVQFVER